MNRDCKNMFTELTENEMCVKCESFPVDEFTPGTLLGEVYTSLKVNDGKKFYLFSGTKFNKFSFKLWLTINYWVSVESDNS